MNVLILGSGGREHALAWKLAQSPKLNALFVAPGNAGTAAIAQNIPIGVNDFGAVKKAVLDNGIGLVIVGPEDPLVNGIHDFFIADEQLREIPVIGPMKSAARLEGSKQFAKEFMMRHKIPTASYRSFSAEQLPEGLEYLAGIAPPYVLKADGLAAGKGVLILDSLADAQKELTAILHDAKFGKAGSTVVIEQFLKGIELSCFILTDGKHYKVLPMAKDYKRIGEGDTGLNTGGMGAISPVPFADEDFTRKIRERIIAPTMQGLVRDELPFQGFIFIGLIKVGDDPYVIEYNVRLGDPETEVVIPRIKNDMLEVFQAVANQNLDAVDLEIDDRTASTVMAVSGGYPGPYEKGRLIEGLENISSAIPFHAGTSLHNGQVRTNGGRVLALTAFGKDYKNALENAYKEVKEIRFEGMYYRKDLGFDL
jgi:phosphoribosylamine--glycine ligase